MKKILIFLAIIILIIAIRFVGAKIYKNNGNISSIFNSESGMRITLISGSALPEYGARNSNSYVIRTKNNKVIVVDGGETVDANCLLNYIMKYGNGKIEYWYLTHPHSDHVGARCDLLEREDCYIQGENV